MDQTRAARARILTAMDISPEAWTSFTQIAGVVILLGTLAFALRRLGVLPPLRPTADRTSVVPAPAPDRDHLERRVAAVELQVANIGAMRREIDQLRTEVRDMHARLNGIGTAVDRLAGKTEATGRETGRTLALIQEHLLRDRDRK